MNFGAKFCFAINFLLVPRHPFNSLVGLGMRLGTSRCVTAARRPSCPCLVKQTRKGAVHSWRGFLPSSDAHFQHNIAQYPNHPNSLRHCANRHFQLGQRARVAWVPWEAPAPATEHRYPVTAWPLVVQGPQSVSQCRYNLTLHLHRRKRSKRHSWGG